MSKAKRTRAITFAMATTALAGAFVMQTLQPAQAQRKSIRWATSSIDSYGYQVAASMAKLVEEALGKEYTVTVQPYPSTTASMKAARMAMARSATPPTSA